MSRDESRGRFDIQLTSIATFTNGTTIITNNEPSKKRVANLWTEFSAQHGETAGNEWEKTAKLLIFLGGCNFRNGKYLGFCRASNSQCGGQGFDPPLLHQ